MTERLARWLLAVGGLFVLAGCGSGSGSSGTGGDAALSFRVSWPQALHGGSTDTPAPFGAPIPPSVARLAVGVAVGGEQVCCVKFDPRDARLSDRTLAIIGLPEGPATVTVSASASGAVSAGGSAPPCAVERPEGVGEPCDDSPCATVSLDYEATADVSLAAGRSSTPDLQATSQTFLFALDPECGGAATTNPPPVTFVVANADPSCTCIDGALQCGDRTIRLDQSAAAAAPIEVLDAAPVDGFCANAVRSTDGRSVQFAGGAVRCCRDDDGCRANGTCCTPSGAGGTAGVTGLQGTLVIVEPLRLGCGEVRIRATVEFAGGGQSPGTFAAAYAFAVPSPSSSPPTPVPTETPLVSPTPNPTLTQRPSSTPVPRRTQRIPGIP